MIVRSLKAEKTVLKNYGFDKVIDISDKMKIIHKKLLGVMLGVLIRLKNYMLEYLKIMEWKLIDMLSTPIVVRKITTSEYS